MRSTLHADAPGRLLVGADGAQAQADPATAQDALHRHGAPRRAATKTTGTGPIVVVISAGDGERRCCRPGRRGAGS